MYNQSLGTTEDMLFNASDIITESAVSDGHPVMHTTPAIGAELTIMPENTSWDYAYYSNDSYEYYDYYYFAIYPFEIIALGMVWPSFVILTMMTNVFVVGYFMSRKNRGKATNLLFISIALSDTLTGLTLIPNSLDIYAKDNTELSASMCNLYMITRFYVSRVFHTVSVWQTVLLGVQRYICVCHPFISARVCTFWKTFFMIISMYAMAAVLHVYHLVDDKLGHGFCRWKIEDVCKGSCVYLWTCIVFQHFFPCLLLLSLTIVTLCELSKAYKRVSTMPGRAGGSKRSIRDRIITITATLIVIVFLIPELPHGIYKVVFVIAHHTGHTEILPPRFNHIFIAVYELALVISFNANFWIYCAMMHDFRKALLRVVTFNKLKRGISRMRLLSSGSRSSRSGSVRTTLSRTSSIASRHRILSLTTSVHSTDHIHAVYPSSPSKVEAHQKFYMKTRSIDDAQSELDSMNKGRVTPEEISQMNGHVPVSIGQMNGDVHDDDMQDDVFL